MADIKDLGIFKPNKGLNKIRAGNAARKESKKNSVDSTTAGESAIVASKETIEAQKVNVTDSVQSPKRSTKKTVSPKKSKGVGAPIRKFDRSFSAQMPLKLSPLLNATSRVMVEKYETNLTRDELLRKALDEYIKQHLTQEDKQDLFNNVMRDIELFREKKPTIPEIDTDGTIIRTVEEIEQETETFLHDSWGMNYKH
ncbi:hypothetical protein OSF83_002848 [Enterococcus hirae]|uniref:Uncharacterized protein n=1 Tax=Enterococcus faecium TaxID=1352 RepID=A0A9X3XUY3_ENTFC|nr:MULTISPECIES: hypothetical protein [Enterococcus]EMF0052981.1 hypothetical protein [Enterococcus hirae]EMF0076448.1 hypothetical protein [Enterococcus hirae]EMF0084272.1 hypothetical protein [Enterococcus hirae]EMF0091824.1 hypothetical protein [Enterococcus hirae]EMF0094629.1 hypothetical protein [Enterococcus hirae]